MSNEVLEADKERMARKSLSIAEWFATICACALVVIVGVSVFCRYVLNIGIDWSDELARLIFVWLIFIGAYVAFKKKSHAKVSVLSNLLPQNLKKYHTLLIGLLEAFFMIVITWFSVILVMDTAQFGQITAGLGVPMAWYYVVMPVTSFLITLTILIHSYRDFLGNRSDQ